MGKNKGTPVLGIALGIIILALCIADSYMWLSNGISVGKAKAAVYKQLPIPLAIAGGEAILMGDFLTRLEILQTLEGTLTQRQKNDLLETMVGETKLASLAHSKNLKITSAELDERFAEILQNQVGEETLKKYNLNGNFFKNHILGPQILRTKLITWFNSQQDLNKPEYDLAETINQKIQNGEDMVILARAYSRDESSRPFGGDMGFVAQNSLPPEMRQQISGMQVGEVKIIPSGKGLHIVRLENKNDDRFYLRQIFLPTAGFPKWLEAETKNLKVRQYIKI